MAFYLGRSVFSEQVLAGAMTVRNSEYQHQQVVLAYLAEPAAFAVMHFIVDLVKLGGRVDPVPAEIDEYVSRVRLRDEQTARTSLRIFDRAYTGNFVVPRHIRREHSWTKLFRMPVSIDLRASLKCIRVARHRAEPRGRLVGAAEPAERLQFDLKFLGASGSL